MQGTKRRRNFPPGGREIEVASCSTSLKHSLPAKKYVSCRGYVEELVAMSDDYLMNNIQFTKTGDVKFDLDLKEDECSELVQACDS